MGRIILVTGGSRSGKSSWAQKTAESMSAYRVFIATCPVIVTGNKIDGADGEADGEIDDEIQERVRKHRAARDKRNWHTIEEPLDIAKAIASANDTSSCVKSAHEGVEYPVVLVDCLTLWINNLMYRAEKENAVITEANVVEECRRVINAAKLHQGSVLFVTNEVGMGIVPENAQARLFRDLAGRCNQVMAEAGDLVVLMVCGLPLEVKGTSENPENKTTMFY